MSTAATVRLGDIAKARMGKTILAKELTESGVPVYSAGRGDAPWGFIPESDVLFGDETIVISARGNIGFPRAPRFKPFVCTQTTIAIQFKDSRHVPYLRYQLETADWPGMTSQTTIPMVTVRQVEGLQLILPDLDKQRRIVAEIEKQFTRLEAGVAALRRVQANLKRYRAAVLKAACEGKLVKTEAELATENTENTKKGTQSASASSEASVAKSSGYETGAELLTRILAERRKNWTGRGKYKEPAAPDTANLPPLPEGWTWASVEQLLAEPLCNGVSVKGSDNPPGVRALRLSAMSDSGFDYSDARYLPLAVDVVDDLWIQEGDFFMSRGNGSLHLVGRGTSAQKPPEPTIFPDTMIRLRLTTIIRSSGWVHNLWSSRVVRSQIESRVKTTAGIYKIAQPQVEGMAIPLPPLAEQTRIVAEVERRLSVVEELESMVSANLHRATRLRQSILQKAFTGALI